MPYVSSGHSTSLRNPCPAGTGIGTGDLNGTIILICDAAFKSILDGINLELALGLGLGLGIPLVCVVFSLFVCCDKGGRRWAWPCRARPTLPLIVPFVASVMKAVEVLSATAYTDFSTDTLSEKLTRELMILRIKEGHDLTDLEKEAVKNNLPSVAQYIRHLYPGDIPVEIRQMATAASRTISLEV